MMRLQLLNSVENVSSGDAKAKDGFHSIQIEELPEREHDRDRQQLGPGGLPDAPPQRQLRRDGDLERVETRGERPLVNGHGDAPRP